MVGGVVVLLAGHWICDLQVAVHAGLGTIVQWP